MGDKTNPVPRGTWVRYLLVLALFAGMIFSGYLAFNVWNRIRALDSAQKDHTEWVFSQLEIEYLKLDRALDQARSGAPEDLENLRKRFDIFFSRVEIAESLQNTGNVAPEILRLRRMLDTQTALIDTGDAPLFDGLDRLQRALRQVEEVPRDIALASIAIAAEAAQTERQKIVRLIEILVLVVLVVTIALVGAIIRLSRQATALNRTSRQAEENHLRLATTLRASLDAVVVIDDEGLIRDFNGSAEEIFGLSRAAALGQNFIELLIPPHLREQQRRNLAAFRSTGQTFFAEAGRRELEMIDCRGRVFPVELSVSLARSADGPIFVSYIRDITDKRQKEAEITRARDEALAAYSEKSRFFAMMSHEMRTPLNGVLSALQLLKDGRLDDEQQKYLDAAITSGDILLGHINDVLAIERSEADTDDQQLQPCDLTALTSGLIGTIDPLAKTSGTRLHLDQRGLNDRPIMTDPRAIQQILVNLLSIAIKFSPDGDVTLRAFYKTSEDDSGGMALHLEVVDDGPGIPPEDIERIFEDFVSLDSRYERRTGGTGLGLGIVRRLVRRLGGEIHCASAPGAGARFTVRLPATPAVAPALPAPPLPVVAQARRAPLQLLVVDDNEINRDLLQAMLKRLGHQVTLATGGREAVALAENTRFDVILMDISMPGMNGIQATRAILSGTGPNRKTPVLAVTAHALPNEREEFKAVGMSGLLLKPLDMKALDTALSDLASANGAAVTGEWGAAAPEHAFDRPVLDETQVSELLEVLGRDKLSERLTTLVQRVDQDLPALVGAQAVRDLQIRSHAMAGMCGMFGADRLHGLLEDIETACKDGNAQKARALVELLPAAWHHTQSAWRQRILQ
ncbi:MULTISPECIES: hybrid sensor histidine kinase/response regulator [Actibacterium]|uniref:histidine kinase n=1 Tax=Actibacterium naphthalenivorans TaxID=1614693 RepID=A0A840CBX1_9RHOB|nr:MULTISPECIES: ATP-binding protein [Actibacterium]ALG89944.1 chemotaxis protein CheY [Actibacterium sp. EMB200-NS6]MBB4020316.1 PAS domain S-box-containing protein [Actibacterium naphthalenivorans]